MVRIPPAPSNRAPLRIDYIVVAYRSADDLAACLDSIAADAPKDATVFVVDNASPDESASVAAEHPIGARVIPSAANLGFGGGCNLAAQHSTADGLLFVNPDAQLCPGATSALSAALDANPRLAIAGPRIVDPTGESRAVSAGAAPSVRSVIGHYLMLGRLPGLRRAFPPLHLVDPYRAAYPDWVSGAAMLVRRDAFNAVGGFDERIFLYMEDVDLCRRVRAAGWEVAYVPSARANHRLGGSQDDSQAARWYRAFHTYVSELHGDRAARVASAAAAVGLALRGLASRRARPANSARVLRAARTAAALAWGAALSTDDGRG